MGEVGATYLASGLLDPSAKAQQPEHTDFSPPIWQWEADGVRDTSSRMERLCIHALLVKQYVSELVSEGEVPVVAQRSGSLLGGPPGSTTPLNNGHAAPPPAGPAPTCSSSAGSGCSGPYRVGGGASRTKAVPSLPEMA